MTTSQSETEMRSEQYEPERNRRIFTFKATQLIWLLLTILEGLLGLRFLLKLIAANPASPIAAFIYSISGWFLEPFRGLTATPSAGGIVLEISTLIAMLIFGLIGWALVRLIWVIFYRPRGRVVEVTRTKSHESPTHHPETPR